MRDVLLTPAMLMLAATALSALVAGVVNFEAAVFALSAVAAAAYGWFAWRGARARRAPKPGEANTPDALGSVGIRAAKPIESASRRRAHG